MSFLAELDVPFLEFAFNRDISHFIRQKLAQGLWGCSYGNDAGRESGLDAYFDHLRNEITSLKVSELQIAIDTVADFLELVEHLRACRSKPRNSPEILAFFPPVEDSPRHSHRKLGDFRLKLAKRYDHVDSVRIADTLALTVNIWLMMNLRFCSAQRFTGRSQIEWPETLSLDDLISQTFPSGVQRVSQHTAFWPKGITACSLYRIGGFQIRWTSNLKDHLLIDHDMDTITLFHFTEVLHLHQTGPYDSVLPPELVSETLHSIALLIPRTDPESKAWFEKTIKNAPFKVDDSARKQYFGTCGRSVEQYQIWSRRMDLIAEAYNNSEPKGLWQWWIDRRKRAQRSNFWIAVGAIAIAIIFGLIGAVTGIMQVVNK